MGAFRWNAALVTASRLLIYRGMFLCRSASVAQEVPGTEGFHLPGGLAFAALELRFALVLLSRMGLAQLVVSNYSASHFVADWLAVRRNTPSANS